jgi:nucleotide-binding universal stress UspA family protein
VLSVRPDQEAVVDRDRSVVLGVSSHTSQAAAAVAADLAQRRHQHLRVVHARSAPAPDRTQPPDSPAVRAVLDSLARDHPGLRVSLHELVADPADLLVEFSCAADAVVVGLRGAGGLADLVVGSTTSAVAARAVAPVVAVPTPVEGTKPRRGVVVGVDGRPGSLDVLAEAFRLAQDLREPMTAVHSWLDPASLGHGAMLPLVHDRLLVAEEESRLLAEVLAGWSEKFPDVELELRTVRERPAVALVTHSAQARLLVVGRHGHPRLRALVLGSVSQAVLHHAPCPVVVVPPDGTAEEER